MEIVEPILCELQVEAEGAQEGAVVQVLDAAGETLLIVESFGVFISESSDAEVREGRTSVLRVPETAAELVLMEGESEVTRQPLRLDLDSRTVIRL